MHFKERKVFGQQIEMEISGVSSETAGKQTERMHMDMELEMGHSFFIKRIMGMEGQ